VREVGSKLLRRTTSGSLLIKLHRINREIQRRFSEEVGVEIPYGLPKIESVMGRPKIIVHVATLGVARLLDGE
jgi:hypothetical protein